jgi:hypothetical protein
LPRESFNSWQITKPPVERWPKLGLAGPQSRWPERSGSSVNASPRVVANLLAQMFDRQRFENTRNGPMLSKSSEIGLAEMSAISRSKRILPLDAVPIWLRTSHAP